MKSWMTLADVSPAPRLMKSQKKAGWWTVKHYENAALGRFMPDPD